MDENGKVDIKRAVVQGIAVACMRVDGHLQLACAEALMADLPYEQLVGMLKVEWDHVRAVHGQFQEKGLGGLPGKGSPGVGL